MCVRVRDFTGHSGCYSPQYGHVWACILGYDSCETVCINKVGWGV